MGPLSRARKWLAIRAYVKRLGPRLIERYGREAAYSIPRIRTTIEVEALSLEHAPLAYAMFAEEGDFVDWLASTRAAAETNVVLDASGPYRSPAAPAPANEATQEVESANDPVAAAAYADVYMRLRAEAARSYGSDRFMPPAEPATVEGPLADPDRKTVNFPIGGS